MLHGLLSFTQLYGLYQTCELLLKDKYNIKWFVLGGGTEFQKLTKMIVDKKLEDNFFLIGETNNPYCWMKVADIYVQPSRSEAKALAITEAQILQRPIVATRNPSINEQIIDGENGYITEPNADSLKGGIVKIVRTDFKYSDNSFSLNNNKIKMLLDNLI